MLSGSIKIIGDRGEATFFARPGDSPPVVYVKDKRGDPIHTERNVMEGEDPLAVSEVLHAIFTLPTVEMDDRVRKAITSLFL